MEIHPSVFSLLLDARRLERANDQLIILIYSLPFAVQPLYNAFEHLDKRYLEVGQTFGLTRQQQFRHLVLPLTRSAFITAIGLSFAHTLGEFGVVLMIGGNIPGETKVISIALFDHVGPVHFASVRISDQFDGLYHVVAKVH